FIEQDFQKFFCAHIQFFREFANCNSFGNRNVAWSARLRRSNNGSSSAAIAAGTLARRVKLALAFHLALVGDGPLALRRTARVKRLAGLCLRRHFVRHRRQHGWPAGHARTGTRSRGNRAAPLIKRTILWTAGSARSSRTRRERTALPLPLSLSAPLLRAHRTARTLARGPVL